MMASEYKHQYLSLTELKDLPATSANECPSVMVWGRGAAGSESEQLLEKHRVARMEDGFVRSIGLGSNFTAPRSLIVDDLGIYFDATRPSRLEYLLQHRDCSEAELKRAEMLIELLLENRISKYSSADSTIADISFYAGNRSDGIANYRDISHLCDHVETGLSIEVTLNLCEQVHTMTSLAGLEALLCGKDVVTYGRPFYAGWGLTRDRCEFERRYRKRSLAELVYICYIEYPGYLDLESGEFTSVERTIAALVDERDRQTGSITVTGLKKYVNIVRNIRKGLTYAA